MSPTVMMPSFGKSKEAQIDELKAENAIQAQRIRHLEEEIARLKKALRIADEAVNIATGE